MLSVIVWVQRALAAAGLVGLRRHSFGGPLRYDRATGAVGPDAGVAAVYAVAGVVLAVRGEVLAGHGRRSAAAADLPAVRRGPDEGEPRRAPWRGCAPSLGHEIGNHTAAGWQTTIGSSLRRRRAAGTPHLLIAAVRGRHPLRPITCAADVDALATALGRPTRAAGVVAVEVAAAVRGLSSSPRRRPRAVSPRGLQQPEQPAGPTPGSSAASMPGSNGRPLEDAALALLPRRAPGPGSGAGERLDGVGPGVLPGPPHRRAEPGPANGRPASSPDP